MVLRTGWPPGLMQDDSRELSRWFASRIDARRCGRVRVMEIDVSNQSTGCPLEKALAQARAEGWESGFYAGQSWMIACARYDPMSNEYAPTKPSNPFLMPAKLCVGF